MLDLSNKSKYVYFDSSAYNCRLDDAKRDQVIEAIKGQRYAIIPSVINLCELLMTGNKARKEILINLYNKLRDDANPLKPPVWLLRDSIKAVQSGLDELEINFPCDITDDIRTLCKNVFEEQSGLMVPYLDEARDRIQSVSVEKQLINEEQYFAYIDSDEGQAILIYIFDEIYKAFGFYGLLEEKKKSG